MKRLTVQAPAKINLTLDITGRRADGYHLLDSVFQTVSIYDILTIEQTADSAITLTSPNPYLPCNQKNIAYKAAEAFFAATDKRCGLHIHIEKHIPSQAGLGGGSADGAAVIFALNHMMETALPLDRLCEIGAGVGADVPFFLLGGTARVQGIGEILTPLRALPELNLVVAKGRMGVSTPEAYKKLDSLPQQQKRHTSAACSAIADRNIGNLICHCSNHFEAAISLPEIDTIRDVMQQSGAKCAVMSGSGAAVYGICQTRQMAQYCCNRLHTVIPYAVTCKTVPEGITILTEETVGS